MLTTDCNGWDEDAAMFGRWGLSPMKSFAQDGEQTLMDGDLVL